MQKPDKNVPDLEQEEENLYAPMGSQSGARSASQNSVAKRQLTPLLVKLIGIAAAFSVAYQLAAEDRGFGLALESLALGVIIGLVAALAPDGHHLGWKSKYWQGTRVFLMLGAIALLLPLEIPFQLFQAFVAFFVCILSLLMVIEWVMRRLK